MATRKRLRSGPAKDHLSLRGKIGAYRLHSLYDPRITTASARAAFNSRFYRQVDQEGMLPEAERERRAQAAKKSYFAKLAYLSAKARSKRAKRNK